MDFVEQFYNEWKRDAPLYQGDTLRVYHEPYLLEPWQGAFFKDTLERLQNIVEKITRLFIEGKFRNLFHFDDQLLKWVLRDPGYSMACPFSRWDSFWDGESLKVLELNTDGTSGMIYIERLNQLYLEIFKKKGVVPCSLKESILQSLLKIFHEFSGGAENPRIAIVDWSDVETRPEQMALADYFTQEGYPAILADPRELDYDGKILRRRDFKIDLIYRRVVTSEYLKEQDKVSQMTHAYLDGNVCVIGSFRSQIGFDKRIFSILSSPEFDNLFTHEENQLKRSIVPWSRVLESGKTTFQGLSIQIPEYVVQNPSLFVIKPAVSNRGRGVLVGELMKKEDWAREIGERLGKGDIIQEKLKVPKAPFQNWGVHLGHFLFRGQLSGWMCRMGNDPVLGDASDDRLVPCFLKNDA